MAEKRKVWEDSNVLKLHPDIYLQWTY